MADAEAQNEAMEGEALRAGMFAGRAAASTASRAIPCSRASGTAAAGAWKSRRSQRTRLRSGEPGAAAARGSQPSEAPEKEGGA